jgi:YidC/Oxa1 family membrane protein insertase
VERRFILAIGLMLLIALLPGILWPPKQAPVGQSAQADSTAVAPAAAPTATGAPRQPASPSARRPAALAATAETVWVSTPLERLGFSTHGAQLVQAQLQQFQSFAPGDAGRRVQLVPDDRPLLGLKLVVGQDTVSLADWDFAPSARGLAVNGPGSAVTFTAQRGGVEVRITYTFDPGAYRFGVRGQVTGLGPQGAVLVVGMGDGLRSVEGDSVDDYRHFAVVTKAGKSERKDFGSLKPGEMAVLDGPFEWVGVKSKYFLAAALALDENQPQFAGAVAVGGERSGKYATRAALALTLPVAPAGEFRYDLFTGPLEYRTLAKVGHDLDDANPYGWIFRPIVKPVSVLVVNILLWVHEHLHLAYGWVLVAFGILIRLLLWPLNQKAMESQMRMAVVQPIVQEIQAKHKNDPEKLQKEMMRVYKEHNVNPLGGCLPMLLPWPVLLALFFVFSNTIEFRGVPWLWLPDLSRADPLHVIPVLLGLSMFVLSKVGQKGVPPNPQMKTMMYFLPVMMTMLFFRLASGLNLYYLVSNIASIPQQYMIAQRRLRQQGKT